MNLSHTDQRRKQPVRIGIAVVESAGRLLVGVRDHQSVLAGLHEFPGGKCHPGESPTECAVRECYEETGLRVDVLELLAHVQHQYDYGLVDLTFVLCCPKDAASAAELCPPFRWVPVNEIPQLNFPEANRRVIDQLIDRQRATDQHGLA